MEAYREITEIFSDFIFDMYSRIGKDGHRLLCIGRPCYSRNSIIIRRLFATRGDKPLYWIDCIPGAPFMDESEVENKVIEDITKGLLWENIK